VLLTILAANGLVLNKEKCVLAVSELDFLVHRISTADVAPLRENAQLFSFVQISRQRWVRTSHINMYGKLLGDRKTEKRI
jgi:hypothetical protein